MRLPDIDTVIVWAAGCILALFMILSALAACLTIKMVWQRLF